MAIPKPIQGSVASRHPLWQGSAAGGRRQIRRSGARSADISHSVNPPLVVTPLAGLGTARIAMGVRKQDEQLARQVQAALDDLRPRIERMLSGEAPAGREQNGAPGSSILQTKALLIA